MKRVLAIAVILIFLLSIELRADSPPVVELHEGLNQIPITIVNKGWRDLQSLSVTVDEGDLPSWIRITRSPGPVDIPAGNPQQENLTLKVEITDLPAEGITLEFPLILRDASGHNWRIKALARVVRPLPKSYWLSQNHPNPFNPTTIISYAIPGQHHQPGSNAPPGVHVKLTIYNLLGQQVVTLVDEARAPGYYTVRWDGRDRNGQQMASGIYLYRLQVGSFVKVNKMVLMQ